MKAEAARLGFVACGITDLAPLPHADALDHWLASGRAGTMRYLHRQARKRKHPQLADTAATRAVVVLANYHAPDAPPPPPDAKVAAYARGTDYHLVIGQRLEHLADFLHTLGARHTRIYVDTGPLAERELAQRAGLGWIAKNTMLIHPQAGSWTLIGTVLTDLPLDIDAPFAADRCGSCRLCLDACPTGAFPTERVLDATRCISYLTIEQKQPIDAELAAQMEGWIFGCDICNAVCPWNERFATPADDPALRPRHLPPARDWLEMDHREFSARFGDTALARTGLERVQRNVRAATDRSG